MAAFYISQRVRKVRGESAGATGTVTAIDPNDPYGQTLGIRHDVALVGYVVEDGLVARACEAGEEIWGAPDFYEPILPGGLESPEEIAELFKPEVMHA